MPRTQPFHKLFRRAKNSDLLKEKSKKAYQKRKEANAENKRRYKIEFAPKINAKNLVKSMVIKGEIMKKSCEICGADKVDAHHDDYAKPLSIRWLCRRHHSAWHAENGEAPNGRAALAAVGVSLES